MLARLIRALWRDSDASQPRATGSRTRLAFETLEPRMLLAASGVTIITHGFQFGADENTTLPEWVLEMAEIVAARAQAPPGAS